ncbi:MAG: RDD family protein [Mobilitalea sp.]
MYCQKCGKQNDDPANYCDGCGASLQTLNTYQPIVTSQNVEYGGFWRRVLASIIDGIITGIVGGMLGFILGASMEAEGFGNLVGLILGWLYFAFMESSIHQGTLGKMAIGMRVTDLDGNRISFARATGRYFGKFVSALILLIGFIMAGFTEKKQALHDMMAGCLVVMKR